MRIRLREGLPCVSATIEHHGQSLNLDNVLVDTGSGGTVVSVDRVLPLGLQYEPHDVIHRIRGVGGSEFVVQKRVARFATGELSIANFDVELGAMDYGFEVDGIIGMDFLLKVGAAIDLRNLELRRAES